MATAKKIKYNNTSVVVDYAIADDKGNNINSTYAKTTDLENGTITVMDAEYATSATTATTATNYSASGTIASALGSYKITNVVETEDAISITMEAIS